MRISDWSSDVCSSDLKGVYGVRCLTYRTRLPLATLPSPEPRPARMAERPPPAPVGLRSDLRQAWISAGIAAALALLALVGVLDRTSVVKGKSVAVRVDCGGRRFLKKKNNS